MKRIVLLILLVTVFGGGYHLGRQEGSPDVFGWCRTACHKTAGAAAKLARVGGKAKQDEAPATAARPSAARTPSGQARKQAATPESEKGFFEGFLQ